MSTTEDPSPRTAVRERGVDVAWRDGVLAELELAPTARSAAIARAAVDRALGSVGEQHLADIAVLLTSELVTNAVLHARSPIVLRMRRDDVTGVLVEVVDRSTAAPVTRSFSDEATTGRGLLLVDAMADEWGSFVDGSSKTVWFRLAGDRR